MTISVFEFVTRLMRTHAAKVNFVIRIRNNAKRPAKNTQIAKKAASAMLNPAHAYRAVEMTKEKAVSQTIRKRPQQY